MSILDDLTNLIGAAAESLGRLDAAITQLELQPTAVPVAGKARRGGKARGASGSNGILGGLDGVYTIANEDASEDKQFSIILGQLGALDREVGKVTHEVGKVNHEVGKVASMTSSVAGRVAKVEGQVAALHNKPCNCEGQKGSDDPRRQGYGKNIPTRN